MSKTIAIHKTLSIPILFRMLIAGMISSIVSLLILPSGYSFSMFYPATPAEFIEKMRLFIADFLLIGGSIFSGVVVLALVIKAIQERRYFFTITVFLVFLNPIQQTVYFEFLNNYLLARFDEKANRLNFIGKTPLEITKILGSLHSEQTDSQRAVIVWKYTPIPFYWVGCQFYVIFEQGNVRSFGIDDD